MIKECPGCGLELPKYPRQSGLCEPCDEERKSKIDHNIRQRAKPDTRKRMSVNHDPVVKVIKRQKK